ncbi:MAG: YbhB/YbcL family Raf kinase inhibitor-like protein [Minisyncoccales bacterium]
METSNELKISTPAYGEGELIPSKYTCDGENVSPELKIENIPVGADTFVLIFDDPDAPNGTFTHWVVFNIPAQINSVAEGAIPGVEGENDFKRTNYSGPCPPSGTHRYFFRLYAIEGQINLEKGVSRKQIEDEMHDKILASASYMGKYSKSVNK